MVKAAHDIPSSVPSKRLFSESPWSDGATEQFQEGGVIPAICALPTSVKTPSPVRSPCSPCSPAKKIRNDSPRPWDWFTKKKDWTERIEPLVFNEPNHRHIGFTASVAIIQIGDMLFFCLHINKAQKGRCGVQDFCGFPRLSVGETTMSYSKNEGTWFTYWLFQGWSIHGSA